MHYLDNASTTQVAPAVANAVQDALCSQWGNPSSLYRFGMQAEAVMQEARSTLAKALGAQPGEVFFTACGSEANNIALLGAARARTGWAKQLVCTGYEHPSVLSPLQMLAEREGFLLTVVAPGLDGRVNTEALVSAVQSDTAVVSAMHVNNETGAVLDVAALAAAVKKKNPRCFVHIDGVQGFCKLPLALGRTAIDGYAVSGHKLHAPKGIGALYLRGGFPNGSAVLPPFVGGGQESGLRPGTQNTAYMAGFAAAVRQATARLPETARTVATLRARLLEGLSSLDGIRLHSPEDGYAGILFFSMPKGLRSQVMLNLLDEEFDVCVSSGSACSGGAPSHTLAAMGVPEALADAALRVSFCGESTEADVDTLLAGLRACVHRLARK